MSKLITGIQKGHIRASYSFSRGKWLILDESKSIVNPVCLTVVETEAEAEESVTYYSEKENV